MRSPFSFNTSRWSVVVSTPSRSIRKEPSRVKLMPPSSLLAVMNMPTPLTAKSSELLVTFSAPCLLSERLGTSWTTPKPMFNPGMGMSSAYECRKFPSLRLKPVDPALAILLVTILSSDVAIFKAFWIVGIILPSFFACPLPFQLPCQNWKFPTARSTKQFIKSTGSV